MTTVKKVYQNVSYSELIQYSKHNPNRHRTLDSIEIRTAPKESTLEKWHLSEYCVTSMDPASILSILAYLHDPAEYSLSMKHARTQSMMDLCTALQQETESLKSTHLSRKRKKLYDLLGACFNESRLEEKEYFALYQGIGYLRKIHFVILHERVPKHLQEESKDSADSYDQEDEKNGVKGNIFFSSDPATWSPENPVAIVDLRGHWIATPADHCTTPLYHILATWLPRMEESGWVISWPEIDGTKVELIEQLTGLAAWNEATDKRLSKDTLSVRLGRVRALAHLRIRT
jgi:hypothetical protein